ncbi:hypothetical protein C8F04DRAFT_1184616 [Mycena alexandri]|uniref:Uncharacterized protein n=1 Tax=Mycena alexandri TaxID=1745969 RepID=A0AAD6X5J6_9AGAR|nr:hypothetical protein C8F04DRAFT_1184616 [Mycena alexandri]
MQIEKNVHVKSILFLSKEDTHTSTWQYNGLWFFAAYGPPGHSVFCRNSSDDFARTILIDSLTSTEEVSAKCPRPDDDEDTPAPKRRGIARSLRQRGPKGPQKEIVVAVPVGRIVASGKGWVEIEADDDI